MDSHSRGNKRPPKGFPIPSQPLEQKRRRYLRSDIAPAAGGTKTFATMIKPGCAFIIAKAYREPDSLCCHTIEQIILQRDFLID